MVKMDININERMDNSLKSANVTNKNIKKTNIINDPKLKPIFRIEEEVLLTSFPQPGHFKFIKHSKHMYFSQFEHQKLLSIHPYFKNVLPHWPHLRKFLSFFKIPLFVLLSDIGFQL
jgi:hypothetical protein